MWQLIIPSGIAIISYYLYNPNNDIEKFYYENDQFRFYILKFSTTILYLTFVLNVKHIIVKILYKIFNKKIYI